MTSPQPTPPAMPGWHESLYSGAAGIALAHVEHARTGTGNWATAHNWVATTVSEPVTAHPDACGLHRGAPAVAFTLDAADRPEYARPLQVLDEHVTQLTRHRLQQAHQRIDDGGLPALRAYDLIRGLTGIGAYLLHRRSGGPLLREVLAYLVRLTQPIHADDQTLPGWWTSHAPNDRPSPRWPGGHGNLGMAHGIAGPLTLLATAHLRGITVPGHPHAIGRICAWLDRWRVGSGAHAWWPETVSIAEHRTGTTRQPGPGRPSWCYGTPGLARAQQLAGLVLQDPDRTRLAENALTRCLADQRQLRQLTDTSLCHGTAGLLYTTWRIAGDAMDPEPFPVSRLLRLLDRQLDQQQRPVHDDNLLEGVTGAHLARHTITTTSPARHWDACLLLGGTANPNPAAALVARSPVRQPVGSNHGRTP